MKLTKIHSDKRGDIYTVTDGKSKEITILKTNKGFARGGCVHRINDEHFCVAKGKVALYYGNQYEELSIDSDTVKIKKKTPHYFVSLTNSIVIEFGTVRKEKAVKNKKFRAEVDKINDKSN